MSPSIPFQQQLEFEYGKVDQLSPLIRRVIAHNPSPYTFYGTGTYILGHQEVAVIDPGPADEKHVEAILAALPNEQVTHILITHTHNDHSPATPMLQAHFSAPSYGYGPHGGEALVQGVQMEEGGDTAFDPDHKITHGQIIEGRNWSVECVHTPGHTSNHMCFQLREEGALFTGDHVMGWATSVIVPPDGNMSDYMDSLALLLERDDEIYWPTHGPAIQDTKAYVRRFIEHRLARETQILEHIAAGRTVIKAMVPFIYAKHSKVLYPAAERSLYAAVLRMITQGRVICTDAEPRLESELRLADHSAS